jgi:hypothetical protein
MQIDYCSQQDSHASFRQSFLTRQAFVAAYPLFEHLLPKNGQVKIYDFDIKLTITISCEDK